MYFYSEEATKISQDTLKLCSHVSHLFYTWTLKKWILQKKATNEKYTRTRIMGNVYLIVTKHVHHRLRRRDPSLKTD